MAGKSTEERTLELRKTCAEALATYMGLADIRGWPGAFTSRKMHANPSLGQELPGGDDGVRVKRHRIDALVHEPLGKVGVVRRSLPADADVLTLGLRSLDQGLQALHHRWVPLVEVLGNEAGVAVQTQRQLREVVASDGEAIKVLQEFLSQEDVAGQLCHHVHLQSVFTTLQAVLLQNLVDFLGHVQGADEGNHDLNVLQAHLASNHLHCFQLHGEALLEERVGVPTAAAEANHGVLLVRLILLTTNEALVLVGLEVRKPHDDALGVHRRRQSGHTLRNLVDIELLWAGIPPHTLVHQGLRLGIQGVIVQECLRVNTDGVVDHKLQAGQANALVGQLTEAEGSLRVSYVHHDLQANLWQLSQVLHILLELQLTLVDEARVALCAGDRHCITLADLLCGITTADNGWDAQLTCNDGSVASAATTVGDDGTGLLHDGLPIRICHVSHQHLALIELGHLINAREDVHLAAADALADGTPLRDRLTALLQHLVLLNDTHLLLRSHGLWTGLHNV
mmetsp:Transcript_6288/g.14487  ORF Transcript_6288/g.14487 Transcript_6288/m.14487 type:complete len:510 (-) Transcript_6288:1331-2860(-)